MHEAIQARFRFATDSDEIPEGRVLALKGVDGPIVTVVIKPGEASQRLLDDFDDQHRAAFETGLWDRLDPTPENEAHPCRALYATVRLVPAAELPDGVLCMPVWRPPRHVWILRDKEATAQLAAEMTELFTTMVQSAVWIQRAAADGSARTVSSAPEAPTWRRSGVA